MSAAPSPDAPGLVSWARLLFCSLIWGGAFMGMSLALADYGPLTVAAGRAAIGAAALLIIGALIGQGLSHVPGSRGWTFAAGLGLLNVALPFGFLTWGLQHVPSALAGVAMGAVPLMVLPLAALFSPGETITGRRVAGLLIGFVGLVVLIGPGAFDPATSTVETLARLSCLAATACYATGSIVTRRAPAMPPLTFTGATLAAAALVLTPLALIVEGPPSVTASTATLALVLVGLFPTGLAFYIRVAIIQTAGSVFMSTVAYIVPLWAVILGITIMGERLSPSLFVALALIIGGIALGQSRRRARTAA